jgi:hypothetical protein
VEVIGPALPSQAAAGEDKLVRPSKRPRTSAVAAGTVPHIHPGTGYADQEPDFAQLASDDAELAPFVHITPSGRSHIQHIRYTSIFLQRICVKIGGARYAWAKLCFIAIYTKLQYSSPLVFYPRIIASFFKVGFLVERLVGIQNPSTIATHHIVQIGGPVLILAFASAVQKWTSKTVRRQGPLLLHCCVAITGYTGRFPLVSSYHQCLVALTMSPG